MISLLLKLNKDVTPQWIPSHVEINENEATDGSAKKGFKLTQIMCTRNVIASVITPNPLLIFLLIICKLSLSKPILNSYLCLFCLPCYTRKLPLPSPLVWNFAFFPYSV